MAFGAEELRVLRRALALALHPTPASAKDVQDCLRLAESLDEATREGARLRAFLVADLARYRAALPGTVAGYLALLEEALGAGHRPHPDDLAALRALRGNPVAAALLDRCRTPAERDVRAHPARGTVRRAAEALSAVPASRRRLKALPGGRSAATDDPGAGRYGAERPAEEPSQGSVLNLAQDFTPDPGSRHRVLDAADDQAGEPARKPEPKPAERPERPAPEPPGPADPRPSRPVPTPGEVFPRRKPTSPPESPPQQLAVG
ncbi:hypothetical protein [Streptomyces sp. ALI-76-A]|uniref:hypothetical protein n=1 Tax=Streptomyces sp. ALI-76-A TaxID=3025736 RepID=UPI00256F1B4F|nr:hypothetical protein [Streptomyces sp. ALI-76-A]MDL5202997.1 hypothetical protein [Streptomyces sp. ALI-76-A]